MNASNAGGIMDKIPQIISGMKQGQNQGQSGQSSQAQQYQTTK
jgi:hypothetical protein